MEKTAERRVETGKDSKSCEKGESRDPLVFLQFLYFYRQLVGRS